jgi:DNA primase
MPGVDFQVVRSAIPIARVLELVGFTALARSGSQLRGSCPLHTSRKPDSRTFSVNLDRNRFRCFKCKAAGGQLELWAKIQGITVYEAAVDLCDRLGIDVPCVTRW